MDVLDPATLKAIDLHLEALYESKATINVAQEMADSELKTSQIRSLETLIMSTRRFSEIINFIKNQAGKDRKGQWFQFVDKLLNQLEAIEEKAREIGANDAGRTLAVKRHLARGWGKQIVAHYLFAQLKKTER